MAKMVEKLHEVTRFSNNQSTPIPLSCNSSQNYNSNNSYLCKKVIKRSSGKCILGHLRRKNNSSCFRKPTIVKIYVKKL